MNRAWVTKLLDKTLAPLGLILRRKRSWDTLMSQLRQQSDEIQTLKSSMPLGWHVRDMRSRWNSHAKESELGYISYLQPGAEWNRKEFEVVGCRFAERIMERFNRFHASKTEASTLLEIGCGVGRFLKPLSSHFKFSTGIDISLEMLRTAQRYCNNRQNVGFILNDGFSLKAIKSNSVEYCLSTGVFQHITDFNIIANYIREAIRVLREGGLFLFQFEGNRTNNAGEGDIGARITADRLDNALAGMPFGICEVSQDPNDRIRNIVIMIRKVNQSEGLQPDQTSFQKFKMSESVWVSGVYDGIETQTSMHVRQLGPMQDLTFYE